ncbi:MAG: glycosyltransferase [Deltaproteobacteria bacterium]
MDLRAPVLKKCYDLFPFPLGGDAELAEAAPGCDISCVINFYGRTDLLRNILTCLSDQTLGKNRFEVILVEDRGGTEAGRDIASHFKGAINLSYFAIGENYGVMGYARNFGLSRTKGRYIIFLDDDTVILDKEFLSVIIDEFDTSDADAVMPRGSASYCLLREKYSYHDPFFPTNRCMAYKRETLEELGGFVSAIIGQEDVELAVRLTAGGKKIRRSYLTGYMHPPLIYRDTNKAAAVGYSFAKLRCRYPFFVWVMLLLNGARYLPELMIPFSTKHRMRGKFGLGFVLGVWYSIIGRKMEYN